MKPRICMVAPFGTARLGVPPVAERVAHLLENDGYSVLRTSFVLNPIGRAIDSAATLLLRSRDYDTLVAQIFSHRNFAYAVLVILLAGCLRKRVVLWYHGGEAESFFSRWPRVVRWVLARADQLAVPSAFLQRAFWRIGFKATIIHNVIETDRWRAKDPGPRGARIVWVRHLHRVYNPALAVRAMEIVLTRRPDARLTIVGRDDAGLLPGLRASADRIAPGRITFTGPLSQPSLSELLSKQDVFISTSKADNEPVSVLEAMAVGLPVIATRVGGIPDLIRDRENGLLVEDDDAEGMAEAILRLLDNPGLADRLVRGGGETVQRHSWSEVGSTWKELLQRSRPCRQP